ncbi:PREDICTED: protein GDAP2 homolog [Priapulus caudatus]|uniref:Protein GDAP2 homolog n=1 Tax=Priapulus caudatus TaxID=37621 RepID=A0ABM1EIB1_PRICU|nr:PREDICTED: protein GDAP2 homolog [Priapulus caudatus]
MISKFTFPTKFSRTIGRQRHLSGFIVYNASFGTGFGKSWVILFFVSLLNSVANRRYIIVYFSSLAEPDNMPEWLLMRRLYVCLSQKYRKNLGGLYVVHPTFWSKMVTWYQTTFNFAEIKDKVQLLGGVEYLYHFVDPQEIVVPNFVLDYDFKVRDVRMLWSSASCALSKRGF